MKTEFISITQKCLDGLQKQLLIANNLSEAVLRPLIVADNNTWIAFGKHVFDYCQEHRFNPYESFVIRENNLYADIQHVESVLTCMRSHPNCIVFAVGSGTINDICKLASFQCGKLYFTFATAPSVDGYTSCGAAICDKGFKKTIFCNPPFAVFGCPDVLSKAPLLLLSSGYGDLIAKVPAGADWIIADELGIQVIDKKSWNLLQPNLRSIVSNPATLMKRNSGTSANVFSGLINSGLAIQELGDSRPASGAEHLFSHTLEMYQHLNNRPELTHGHKVALGTMVSTAFYELFLSLSEEKINVSLDSFNPPTWNQKQNQIINTIVHESLIDGAINSCRAKFVTPEDFPKRKELISQHLLNIRERVRKQLLPLNEIRRLLVLAQCPVSPSNVGLSAAEFLRIIKCSNLIRSRYTILDLLEQCGLFDSFAIRVVEMLQ